MQYKLCLDSEIKLFSKNDLWIDTDFVTQFRLWIL